MLRCFGIELFLREKLRIFPSNLSTNAGTLGNGLRITHRFFASGVFMGLFRQRYTTCPKEYCALFPHIKILWST